MPTPKGHKEWRGTLPEEFIQLLKLLIKYKNSGEDWTAAKATRAAFLDWIQRPENAELIVQHKLLERIEGNKDFLKGTLFDKDD